MNADRNEVPGVDGFFDSIADEYAEAILRCFPRYPEMLWALMYYLPDFSTPPKILELGCGTGNCSLLLAERFADSELTLVDISADSLDVCRKRLEFKSNVEFVIADMRELNFDDGQFDLVASTIALHHLTSVEKQSLFQQIYSWLRPRGVFTYSDQFSAASERVNGLHHEQWKQVSFAAGASEQEWEMWMVHQNAHDHHDRLLDQLDWLTAAGFERPDALWRYLLWTLIQTCKSPQG